MLKELVLAANVLCFYIMLLVRTHVHNIYMKPSETVAPVWRPSQVIGSVVIKSLNPASAVLCVSAR